MALPELFGSYILHHQLARGVTSDVFLAQTTGDFPRLCTVKRIRPEFAALPGFVDRFKNDAQLLVQLTHGNIAQVLEVGAVEETLFIAMEQVDGVALPDVIAKVGDHGALPTELALYVVMEMCEAIVYLHRRQSEVRGTSTMPFDTAWPLEVMLSFDGVLKLIDLGSFGALRLGQQKINQLFQSPGYAVPEVILKKPIDERSSMFAVGVIGWELLAGRRLIASDPEEYVKAIVKRTWKVPLIKRADVPGDVTRTIMRLLSMDPSKRPDTLQSVRDEFGAHLRRIAPAYGSSSMARLLWNRFPEHAGRIESLTKALVRDAVTHQTSLTSEQNSRPTKSFGASETTDRLIDDPDPLRPGALIPGTRYRMVRSLGTGGSAEVFAAQHIDLDRQVALKILSSELARKSGAITQFRLEARACSRIRHANVVDVIDFGQLDDGRFYFAMELIDGQSMADVLAKERSLSPERALPIFRQIAKGVAAAHKFGIVHRDLKPENIMLVSQNGRRDVVKVLDFGVGAFIEGPEKRRVVGTPGYMAPEQVYGDPPSSQMDIYAVGATMYEALSAKLPYRAASLEEYVQQQGYGPPAPLTSHPRAEQVPKALERVVMRALELVPDDRQRSMNDFEQDLLWAQEEAGIVTDWNDLSRPDGKKPATQTLNAHEGIHPKRTNQTSTKPLFLRSSAILWLTGAALFLAIGVAYAIWNTARTTHIAIDNVAQSNPRASDHIKPQSIVAASLERARIAANQGNYTQPEQTSALDHIVEADRLSPDHPQTLALRATIAKELAARADRLNRVGPAYADHARTLYQESLAFKKDPHIELLARTAHATKTRPRPEARAAKIAQLLVAIEQAVHDGNLIGPPGRNALLFLKQLKTLDPTGRVHRDVSQSLRERAEAMKSNAQYAHQASQLLAAINKNQQGEIAAPTRAPGALAKTVARQPTPISDAARARRSVSRGNALLAKHRLDSAYAAFVAAARVDPANGAATLGMATVLFNRRNFTEAVRQAERAVALSRRGTKQQARALLLLGDSNYRLLRYQKARHAYKRILFTRPTHRIAKQRIAQLDADRDQYR